MAPSAAGRFRVERRNGLRRHRQSRDRPDGCDEGGVVQTTLGRIEKGVIQAEPLQPDRGARSTAPDGGGEAQPAGFRGGRSGAYCEAADTGLWVSTNGESYAAIRSSTVASSRPASRRICGYASRRRRSHICARVPVPSLLDAGGAAGPGSGASSPLFGVKPYARPSIRRLASSDISDRPAPAASSTYMVRPAAHPGHGNRRRRLRAPRRVPSVGTAPAPCPSGRLDVRWRTRVRALTNTQGWLECAARRSEP